jgi:hypothetical protein
MAHVVDDAPHHLEELIIVIRDKDSVELVACPVLDVLLDVFLYESPSTAEFNGRYGPILCQADNRIRAALSISPRP